MKLGILRRMYASLEQLNSVCLDGQAARCTCDPRRVPGGLMLGRKTP
jgi:hypothetical protein